MIRASLRYSTLLFAVAVLVGCTAGGRSTTSAATTDPSTSAQLSGSLTGITAGSPTAVPEPAHPRHKTPDKPPVHDPNNPVAPGFRPSSVAFWNASDGLLAGWIYSCRCNAHQGAIAVTHDGGESWRLTYKNAGEVPSITVSEAGTAVATLGYSHQSLLRSTDWGSSWRPWAEGRRLGPVTFSSADQGLAFAQVHKRLVRWNGSDWRPTKNPCGGDIVGLSMPQGGGGIAWLACSMGAGAGNELKAIYETTDAGRNWHARTIVRPDRPSLSLGRGLGSYGYMQGIAFTPDGEGWLTESRGSFYSTTDGGSTWAEHSGFQQPETAFGSSVWRVNDALGFVLIMRPGRLVLHESWTGGRYWSKVAVFQNRR